ncbi:MAG: PEGA domain-containing protein [Candidatus Bipolaricaulota bacterium]|nr:PEGA domain-containing protein [Candidatus Bipolaricaulota bacterium]
MRQSVMLVMLVLLGFGGAAQQPGQPIPEGIIVQPAQTPLAVQLGLEKALYTPGERLRLSLALNQDAYVYIYNITPDRRVNLLFPNAYQPVNFLRAGVHTIPNQRYSLVISPTMGLECIQVLALAAPLPLEQLIPEGKFSPQNPFPLLSQKPQEFKAFMQNLIVGAVSTTGWAAAWTCFQVAAPQARLRVISNPTGALVSVNGIVVGQTPLELTLAPGRYRVALSRFGYEEWSQTVELKRGSEVTLEAQLTMSFRPLGRTARLRIVSDPDDADVFINDAYAGRTPLSLEIVAGRYRVVVTKASYESWAQTIELRGDSDITLEAVLRPLVTSPTPPVAPTPLTPPSVPREPIVGALPRPTVLISLNGGLSAAQIPSLGFEFGFLISQMGNTVGLGFSFLMTGEDVPDYEDVGRPIDLGPTTTYREGPETEFYGKFSLALLDGFTVDIAGGLAVQKEAHIALPLGPMRALDVIVKPNGYQTERYYLTWLLGLSLRLGNLALGAGMHNRRGWVIGVGVAF